MSDTRITTFAFQCKPFIKFPHKSHTIIGYQTSFFDIHKLPHQNGINILFNQSQILLKNKFSLSAMKQ